MKHPVITPKSVLSALGIALLVPSAAHSAAINYGVANATYTQNFDSLASSGTANPWTNGTTVTGWHWLDEQGAVPTTYTTNSGSGARDQITSLGTASAPDRAFGGQNDDLAATYYFGAQILNSTGTTLETFTLTYTGEQWRVINGETRDQLSFQYQIFDAGTGSLSAATGWNAVSELNFDAPKTTSGGSTGLDGNATGNNATISASVLGLTWSEGQEIWLRWADNNPGTPTFRRAQVGIDDVSFSATAIPEPSTYAVLAGALSLGLAASKRRRADASGR